MSDTNRHLTRRPAVQAPRAPIQASAVVVNSPARIDALRRMVAAGQYQVNPHWLATRIMRVAGVKVPE